MLPKGVTEQPELVSQPAHSKNYDFRLMIVVFIVLSAIAAGIIYLAATQSDSPARLFSN